MKSFIVNKPDTTRAIISAKPASFFAGSTELGLILDFLGSVKHGDLQELVKLKPSFLTTKQKLKLEVIYRIGSLPEKCNSFQNFECVYLEPGQVILTLSDSPQV